MIKLFTDQKHLGNQILIDHNDGFFDLYVKAADFLPEGLAAIKTIDNAEFLGNETRIVTTPFGEADITCFSTGLKTVLNLICIHKHKLNCALNISYCGGNALRVLFKLYQNLDCNVDLLLQVPVSVNLIGYEASINSDVIVPKEKNLTCALAEILEV
jgi:hypothetical protein